MKTSQLIFKKVEGDSAQLRCNYCGSKKTLSTWRVAYIPVHNGKNEACIVVCSKSCLKRFLIDPNIDEYLQGFVHRIESISIPPLSKTDNAHGTDILKCSAERLNLQVSIKI